MGDLWKEGAGSDRSNKVIRALLSDGETVVPIRILTVDCQIDYLYAVIRSWNGGSGWVKVAA